MQEFQTFWRSRPLRALCVGWIAVATLAGCERAPHSPVAIDRNATAPAAVSGASVVVPFTLLQPSGEPVESSSLRGKVWLASVFFANCPGTCFRENQAVADMLRAIPDPDFVAVSLTCDPENDTPDVLRRYAERFDAQPDRWKFLTGDMATIKEVANKTFLLPAEVGVHSERGVVFDRQGHLRGSYHLLQSDRVKLLEKLIREVLAETDSTAPHQRDSQEPSP